MIKTLQSRSQVAVIKRHCMRHNLNIYNSPSQSRRRTNEVKATMSRTINNEQENLQHQNKNDIIQLVLHAVTLELSPIKIIFEPKVTNHQEGTRLLNELISYIQDDFSKMKRCYNRLISFDT